MAFVLAVTNNFIDYYNFMNVINNGDYHSFINNLNDVNVFLPLFPPNVNDVNDDVNSFAAVADVHNLVNYSANYTDCPIISLILLLMHYIYSDIFIPFIVIQIILINHHPFALSITLLFRFYKYKDLLKACF